MRWVVIIALIFVAGCSSSSTSPTAPTPPAVVVTPPVVVVPPIATPPAPNPLLSDPRFDLNFYRRFALDSGSVPLNRRAEAPMVYLATSDTQGRAVDNLTLDRVSEAMIIGMSSWALPFGLAGIQRGATSNAANRITVLFDGSATATSCGITTFDNRTITFSYGRSECLCAGRLRARTIKHELGHALGFTHTGDAQDLMSGLADARCDQNPSDREIFHARVAYSLPIGSLDP